MSHMLPFLSDTHTQKHTALWSIYDHTPPHCQCIKTHSQSTSDTITLFLFSLSLFMISFSVLQEVQFRVQSLSHTTVFSLMLCQKPGTNNWVHFYQGCSIKKIKEVDKPWTSEDNQMHDCKRWTPTYIDIHQSILHIYRVLSWQLHCGLISCIAQASIGLSQYQKFNYYYDTICNTMILDTETIVWPKKVNKNNNKCIIKKEKPHTVLVFLQLFFFLCLFHCFHGQSGRFHIHLFK